MRAVLVLLIAFLSTTNIFSQAENEPKTARKRSDDNNNSNNSNKYQLDTDRFMFDRIMDEMPVLSEDENPDEFRAYNYVVSFAHQFEATELESVARRDLTFKDLFRPIRKEFKLDLIRFEGLLRRCRSIGPNRALKEAGVDTLYEGWLVPRGQPNPVCILFTELPPGISAQKDLKKDIMDKWVSFSGYSFKLMKYESSEVKKSDPLKGVAKLAPLMIGKGPILLNDQTNPEEAVWHKTFLPVILVGIGLLTITVFVLAWWYRRNDQYVRDGIAARQEANPFERQYYIQ